MKLEHAAGRDARPPTHALRTRTHPARAAARPTEGRDRAEVRITHPERVIDASTGITKGELAAYFERSAALLLWHLADRPVALLRAPHGLDGERFFQKHAPAGRIAGARQLPASLDAGHERLLALDSPRALMGAAQMNTVELHTWNAQAHDIEHPDRLILDLDPGEGVDGRQLREAARLAHELLRSLELRVFLKTSGGRGLHLVVPLAPRHDWERVRRFSQALAQRLVDEAPQCFVGRSGASHRVGRIFVDVLRNARGATTVAAFSPRARPGLPVSQPLAWDELGTLELRHQADVRTSLARLEEAQAAWAGYRRVRQGLARAERLI